MPFVQELEAKHPQNAYVAYELAIFYREARKHEEAYAQFEKVQALSPDNPEIYYDLGTMAMNLAKIPEALDYLERYVAMNPNNPPNLEAAKAIIPELKKATASTAPAKK
jgi:tetratricopeptide (TPR) repeat protein